MQLNAHARARTEKEDYVLFNTSDRSYDGLLPLHTGLKEGEIPRKKTAITRQTIGSKARPCNTMRALNIKYSKILSHERRIT
ncbi:hypothetical protein NDU88_000227 [Pleurodeles waltl]|uniref:Uncharacterized protein n=1 Tax=Pleurodeles waltl TaxID=8319 RepID=A0AAV7Q2H3_PLEWA|nr:hypothetical protein NDU88_000227 [Pleurodeles waltl]